MGFSITRSSKPESISDEPAPYKQSRGDLMVGFAMYFGPSIVLGALGAFAGRRISKEFPSIVTEKAATTLGVIVGATAGAVAVAEASSF